MLKIVDIYFPVRGYHLAVSPFAGYPRDVQWLYKCIFRFLLGVCRDYFPQYPCVVES